MSTEIVAATPKLDRFSLWKSDADLADIHFGFEFEFASEVSHEDFAESLSDALSIPESQITVTDEYNCSSSTHKNYRHWNVEGDSSIPTHGDEYEIELVTPPYNIGYWSSNLEDVLSLVKRSGRTVLGTGAHITFSYDKLRTIDPVKFALFMNDINVADTFGRALHDQYAKLYLKRVRDYVLSTFDVSGKNIGDILRKIRDSRPDDLYSPGKYSTINLNKLNQDPPLIEVRSPGGYNYEDRAVDFLHVCRIIASALILACDPDAYSDVYAHKFAKLLATGTNTSLVSEGVPVTDAESDVYMETATIAGTPYEITVHDSRDSGIFCKYEVVGTFRSLTLTYSYAGEDVVLDCDGAMTSNLASFRPIVHLIKLILNTPIGSYFPGIPSDFTDKITDSLDALGKSDSIGSDTIDALGKRPESKIRISHEAESILKAFIRPTASSLINVSRNILSDSVSDMQIEYLTDFVKDLIADDGQRIERKYKDTDALYAAAPDILDALAAYAGKREEGELLHLLFRALGSNLIPRLPTSKYTDLSTKFVDAIPLGSGKALSFLSGVNTFAEISSLPSAVKTSMQAQIQARVDSYIEQAPQEELLNDLYTSIAAASPDRVKLQRFCLLCLSKPHLKDLLLGQVLGNFEQFSRLAFKRIDFCNLIWVVGELSIPDSEKITLWRAQRGSTPKNMLLRITENTQDVSPLSKWELSAGSDTDTRTEARKEHAVMLFAAMLHTDSAAISAYDDILTMYKSLPEDLRMGCTRYVFSQLSNIMPAPRAKLWYVLCKFLNSMVPGVATCTESDTGIVYRSGTLPKFTEDVDKYLGEGSSYWRKDRPDHLRQLSDILSRGISADGTSTTLRHIVSIADPESVYITFGQSRDPIPLFNVRMLQEYVAGLLHAEAAIEERPKE